MSLLEFFDGVYLVYHPDCHAPAAEQFRIALRLLERSAGRPLTTADLSEDLLYRFAKWLHDNGRSPGTIKSRVGTVLSVWREAVRAQQSPPLPSRVPRVRVPRRLPKAWHMGELSRLLAACREMTGGMRGTDIPRSVWWSSKILFLYESGSRIGASLAIRRDEVCLSERAVRLSVEAAKTGYEQLVRISDETAAAMADLLACPHPFPQAWPYCARREALYETLKVLLRRAGLPDDRTSMFHCLRRTNATWSARCGSLELAQRQLGHTSPEMTLGRYIDPRIMRMVDAVDVLPRPGRG